MGRIDRTRAWVDAAISQWRSSLWTWARQSQSTRTAQVFAAVGGGLLIVAGLGLSPPYLFAELLPDIPRLWVTLFITAGVSMVAYAIEPRSGRLWLAAFVLVTLALGSRMVGLGLLADASSLPGRQWSRTGVGMYGFTIIGWFIWWTVTWVTVVADRVTSEET